VAEVGLPCLAQHLFSTKLYDKAVNAPVASRTSRRLRRCSGLGRCPADFGCVGWGRVSSDHPLARSSMTVISPSPTCIPHGAVNGDHGGPTLSFEAMLTKSGACRLFLQFQTAGTLHTAAISLSVG
jgi:hypothetical protein